MYVYIYIYTYVYVYVYVYEYRSQAGLNPGFDTDFGIGLKPLLQSWLAAPLADRPSIATYDRLAGMHGCSACLCLLTLGASLTSALRPL